MQILGTPGLHGIKTPALHLETAGGLVTFEWQSMAAFKLWNGLTPYWMVNYEDYASPPTLPWSPPNAARIAGRKRFASSTVEWSFDGADDYTATFGVTGPGVEPTGTGMPATILDDGTIFPPNSDSGTWFWNRGPIYANGLATPFFGHNSGTNGVGGGPYFPDWSGTSGWTGWSGDFNADREHFTCTLTDEIAFSDVLAIATDRLTGRTWPTFSNSLQSGDWEGFDEWPVGPANTGDPVNAESIWSNITTIYPPYFGASPVYPQSENLWSGWYYPTMEEVLGCDSQNNSPTSMPILSQRVRFRRNQAVVYFIASANMARIPPSLYSGGAGDEDFISDVVVLETGTLAANTIKEVGFTTETDFTNVTRQNSAETVLSVGAIKFCILGETPAQWSTRTGIDYT